MWAVMKLDQIPCNNNIPLPVPRWNVARWEGNMPKTESCDVRLVTDRTS
ncbi:hypothetical protein LEMLEM_LOCUS1950, partial [Lemmus lemmus]